jgi:hypothetical protein
MTLGDIALESIRLTECCYVLFIDELCICTLYMKIYLQRESAYSALLFRVQSSSGHEISLFISLVPAVTLNSTQT